MTHDPFAMTDADLDAIIQEEWDKYNSLLPRLNAWAKQQGLPEFEIHGNAWGTHPRFEVSLDLKQADNLLIRYSG